MTRKLIAFAAAAAVALVVTSAAVSRADGIKGKLVGTVGPGYSIKLTMNGKKVKSLPHGTYKFVIHDKASIHNFVVEQESGGKFEKDLTDVSQVGTVTKKIKLTHGKWKYYCKPHESVMFGFFRVK